MSAFRESAAILGVLAATTVVAVLPASSLAEAAEPDDGLQLTQQGRTPNYDFFDIRMQTRQRSGAAGPAGSSGGISNRARVSVYTLGETVTGRSADSAESIARRYIHQNIRQSASALSQGVEPELSLEHEFQTGNTGLTHLTFRQTYADIPVFGGQLQVHVLGDGSILRADLPGLILAPQGDLVPAVTADSAVSRVSDAVGISGDVVLQRVSGPQGPDLKTVFAAEPLVSDTSARLVYFPMATHTELAWELFVSPRLDKTYHMVVSAVDGEILFSHNLAVSERPQGSVFRAPRSSSDSDVGAAHPDAGAQTTEPLTGWPASGGDCAQPGYSGGTECWVSEIFGSGFLGTFGNNGVAWGDFDEDGLFETPLYTDPHFDAEFTDSYAAPGDPLADLDAALVNLFYWINVVHDWLYDLGFTEAAGNFQLDNFGRGGLDNDLVDALAQAIENNATMFTPPDGQRPQMTMGLFDSPQGDSAFDADVIVHEYVHGLSNRLVGGPSDAGALWFWQSGAMGEGWSDIYAVSFTGDPVLGEYSTGNPTTGFRSVAYDNSPHTFGLVGTLFDLFLSPNPPKDTDGRREESGRGVRELQGK